METFVWGGEEDRVVKTLDQSRLPIQRCNRGSCVATRTMTVNPCRASDQFQAHHTACHLVNNREHAFLVVCGICSRATERVVDLAIHVEAHVALAVMQLHGGIFPRKSKTNGRVYCCKDAEGDDSDIFDHVRAKHLPAALYYCAGCQVSTNSAWTLSR